MTVDRYGRYVGRHRDWRDMPRDGYAPGDERHRLIARALTPADDAGDRYDRPITDMPVPCPCTSAEPRVPLATVSR